MTATIEQPEGAYATMSSAMAEAHNYSRWVVDLVRDHLSGEVLEIGTGFAVHRSHLPLGVRLTSADIDRVAVENARAADPAGRYLVADAGASDFAVTVGRAAYDSVLCLNVLEHIPDDRAALANMVAALRPGGRVCLYVPAHPALYTDMDRLAGHHRRYTRRSLAEAFAGLPVMLGVLDYINPIGGLGWWANKFKRHEDLDAAGINRQIVVFDRYVLPLSRLLTPLTRGFFGQSLVCIATKTA